MQNTFSLPNRQNFDFSTDGDGAGQVCIANISPAERKKRLHFSIVQFIIGFTLLAVMILSGADPAWRLLLFLVFSAAGASYFQAKDKT